MEEEEVCCIRNKWMVLKNGPWGLKYGARVPYLYLTCVWLFVLKSCKVRRPLCMIRYRGAQVYALTCPTCQ